jgi:hypothetical protein
MLLNRHANTIFPSIYGEWWCKHGGNAPPITELGLAAIRAQDVIDFVNDPNHNLEDLFAKIDACHVRVKEYCHMINRGDWLQDKTEEAFLFSTTQFLRGHSVPSTVPGVMMTQ